MFQVALSSFSHLTFSTADIMHEKIFCKSMETALFINPLFSIRLYLSHYHSSLVVLSLHFIALRLVIHLLDLSALEILWSSGILRIFEGQGQKQIKRPPAVWGRAPRGGNPVIFILKKGHCTTFCPTEGHPSVHFIPLSPLELQSRTHFIMLSSLEGHPGGHVFSMGWAP